MKRFLCVFLSVLLLLPLFFIPVFAAADKEYLFERFEIPVALDVFPFFPNDSLVYIYEGYLPEGLYTIDGSFTPSFAGYSVDIPGVHFVQYEYIEGDDLEGYAAPLSLSFTLYDPSGDVMSIDSGEVVVFVQDLDSEPFTMLAFTGSDEFTFIFDSCKFVSYDQGNGLIGDFLEDPNNVFNPIISILPVVIPVVVSFVGTRKVISWLRSKLSGA